MTREGKFLTNFSSVSGQKRQDDEFLPILARPHEDPSLLFFLVLQRAYNVK
jgi:hypothetical protein